MALAVIEWPRTLPPMQCTVAMTPRTLSGAASLSGIPQVIATPAGIWRISYDGVPLNTPDRIKMWRTIEVQAEGRANAIIVPIFDRPALIPLYQGGMKHYVPHADDADFDDVTQYTEPAILTAATSSAAAGATTVVVAKTRAGTIEPGQHFSTRPLSGNPRLYRVKSITAQSALNATVKVWPPLRAAITAGDLLDFETPVCTVRLADDAAMNVQLMLSRTGSGSVSFIEDVS